jgi:hypothetical protein
MVAFVSGLSNWGPKPGSPEPITFGMANDPSQSISLNPGAGNLSGYGLGSSYGTQSVTPGTPAASPQGSMGMPSNQTATNLAPVHVTSPPPPSSPMFGDIFGGSSTPGGPDSNGFTIKDLAPVKVAPQMPMQPNMFDRYMMWSNDHPVLSKLAESVAGGVTGLSPVMVAAHAYYNSQHGKSLLGSLGNLFSGIGSLGSGGDSGGGPLGNSPNTPLFSNRYGPSTQSPGLQDGPGPSASGVYGAPSIASSGALPLYPGMSPLPAGSAPIGGFWNQRALRDAAPTYGPYSGFGQGTTGSQIAPAFAPNGIQSLGSSL